MTSAEPRAGGGPFRGEAGMPESMVMRTSSLKNRAVFDRYNVVDGRYLRIATCALENLDALGGTVAASEPKTQAPPPK
jgi:hypothetical protein